MANGKKITGNRVVDKLDTYQSANSDYQVVKHNFIIRLPEFQLIIDDLINKKGKDPLQHELILGRRGSGKSTLLKRIQIEIEENSELSKKYIAINLAEEQAGIYRLFDLWLEVLRELGNIIQITFSIKGYDTFINEQSYTRYLYEEISKALKAKKKKIVLLLDNLDRIIENFDDDGNLLREILHNYNDIQIIGGSTRMDEHFWRYDKPFYEFFRRHRLGSLSSKEIHLLLNHWGELMDLPELKTFTQNNPGKIEVVRILTDGLPRTLQFFIDILLQDSTLYGFDYIRKVMDKVTPLYQERLNNLPAPQRKIVLETAFLWEACTAKQLVQKCNMESKLISAHLKQLSNIGIIETLSTSKKNHLYRISERFFNIWLIVTQGNPEQKRKAKWLTISIETWYDSIHLKTFVSNHIENLKIKKLPHEKALILTKAFSQSKYINEGRIHDVEKYYLQAIEKGNINALHNLALYYYENNKHKKIALDFIYKYFEQNPHQETKELLIIIEIWNAVFKNIEERIWQSIIGKNYENLNWFFFNLLIQEQIQLVSNIFSNEMQGAILRNKYSLFYYTMLLLTNKQPADNLEQIIPPEVMPTVLEIKEKIEQNRAMYAK